MPRCHRLYLPTIHAWFFKGVVLLTVFRTYSILCKMDTVVFFHFLNVSLVLINYGLAVVIGVSEK